tara:strand:+ start:24 stop:746 length:723 start_codon:yes stop_codon:yes gene_type:complete
MISISCPSRGRPQLAKRMIDTAYNTAADDIEFLIYLNNDDPALEEYKDTIDKKHYTVGPNRSTCYSWNLMAEKARYDYVFLAGDDIQFKTENWDTKMVDGFTNYPDKILMAIPYDGKDKNKPKNLLNAKEPTLIGDVPFSSPHFLVHKNWINTLGYFVPPFFWHWYVDTYTQKVSRKLNRCLYLPDVTIKAKKVFDDTGKQVRKHLDINFRDDYVWSKIRERHLNADVDALKKFIKDFKK